LSTAAWAGRLGASLQLNENVTLSLAWMHGFRADIRGPILQIPHAGVRLDAQYDSIVAGLNVAFGGSRRKAECSAADPAPAVAAEQTPTQTQ
jgi:hypothetical protein